MSKTKDEPHPIVQAVDQLFALIENQAMLQNVPGAPVTLPAKDDGSPPDGWDDAAAQYRMQYYSATACEILRRLLPPEMQFVAMVQYINGGSASIVSTIGDDKLSLAAGDFIAGIQAILRGQAVYTPPDGDATKH